MVTPVPDRCAVVAAASYVGSLNLNATTTNCAQEHLVVAEHFDYVPVVGISCGWYAAVPTCEMQIFGFNNS